MNDNSAPPPPFVHNLAANRFEAAMPGGIAEAAYRRIGDTLHLVHTDVPPESQGRGIAGALVEAVLDCADANGAPGSCSRCEWRKIPWIFVR